MRSLMKVLVVGFLLWLPGVGNALTLSELQTEVRLRVKDTHTARQRYTDAQITNFVNEAQRDVINNTWAVRKSTEILLVISTTYYTLPDDVLALERVTLDRRTLPEATLIKLDADNNGGAWEDTTGRPRHYFQDPAQTNAIGVFPYPSTSAQVGTLRVIYFAQADDLSDSTDEPFNGQMRFLPYHDLLIFYTAYRIYLIEGEVDKAGAYRQEYESRLAIMNERIGSKPNYVPGMAGPKDTR